MTDLSAFQAKVIDLAAKRMDNSNVFDLSDEGTKSYVQGLFNKVVESVGCEPKELFGFTAEDFAKPMAEAKFGELTADEQTPEESVLESAISAVAEDSVALFGLFKEFGEKQDELLTSLTPVEEAAPEATVEETAEGEEAAVETPEGEEVVAEGAPAEGEEAAATEDEGTDEEVAEGAVTLSIVDPAEQMDDTPWADVDKGAIKDTLKKVMEAGGEGYEVAIAEVYAVVGDVADPTTWKYPHHIIEESGAIVLSSTGLAAASNFIQSGRFTGSDEAKQGAATHLQGHYDTIQQAGEADGETVTESAGYPGGLRVMANLTPGVRTVSIDMIDGETIVPFEAAALTDAGKNVAVIEACANMLHGAGMLKSITDPTLLTVSADQLKVAEAGLSLIAEALMGNLPEEGKLTIEADETVVTESAAQVEELSGKMKDLESTVAQLTGDLALRDSQIEALSLLSEGSALEGIAESVVASQTIEQVKAFKAVTEAPGLKRLITAAGNAASTPTPVEGEETVVTESGAGTRGLENLDTIFEKDDKKTKGNKVKTTGHFAALHV